jgi:hypothetical protein
MSPQNLYGSPRVHSKKEIIGYTSDGYIPVVAGLLRRGGGQILDLVVKIFILFLHFHKFPCLKL